MTKFDLSILNIITEYKKNENIIKHYLSSKKSENFTIEGYDCVSIMGLSIGFFIILMFAIFIFYIWAIWALLLYKDQLPDWAIILAIISLFIPTGPIGTLLIVYLMKGKKEFQFNFKAKPKEYVF